MNQLVTRTGVRALSVGLLVAALIGGVHIGQHHHISTGAPDALQVEADDMQLLKMREGQSAATRAFQRQAEGDAAEKAATAAADGNAMAKKMDTKVADNKAAAAQKKAAAADGPVAYNGPIPSSCNEYSGSRAIGCALMLSDGFGLDQFPCLDNIFSKESGWNYKAENRGSGAYGIPQALPGSKMASAGSDWKSNPATQIKWGLGYIKGRYDSPCGAWSHWQSAGSY